MAKIRCVLTCALAVSFLGCGGGKAGPSLYSDADGMGDLLVDTGDGVYDKGGTGEIQSDVDAYRDLDLHADLDQIADPDQLTDLEQPDGFDVDQEQLSPDTVDDLHDASDWQEELDLLPDATDTIDDVTPPDDPIGGLARSGRIGPAGEANVGTVSVFGGIGWYQIRASAQ